MRNLNDTLPDKYYHMDVDYSVVQVSTILEVSEKKVDDFHDEGLFRGGYRSDKNVQQRMTPHDGLVAFMEDNEWPFSAFRLYIAKENSRKRKK